MFKNYFLTNYNQSELQSLFGSSSSGPISISNDLITCKYDNADCDANDFEYSELGDYQKCYSFNSGYNFNGTPTEIRPVSRYGKNYGLHVELFLDVPENCKTPLSPNYGLVVFIHNSTNLVWDETNGFDVMSGYETDVAVDRTRLLKLPAPFSDCIDNTDSSAAASASEAVLSTFQLANSYTQQTCLQLCYQDFLVAHYNCYDSKLPFNNQSGISPCFYVINSTSSIFSDKVI